MMDVLLRRADDGDMALVMSWRSNPDVYKNHFYTQQKPLTWREHKAWWQGRNKDWHEFIIEICDGDFEWRPVGMVTVGQLDNYSPEVGYAIGEVTLWGKGVVTQAVFLVIQWLKNKGYKHLHTTILDSNKASQRVTQKLGFKKVCPARDGESRWELKIE
jgi:RimJ/RimL family protein N-acetyltransferase